MHRDALDYTSVVDEDVYLSYFLVYLLYESLDSHLVCHVAYIALDILYSCCLVVVKTALQSCLVDVVEDNGLNAGFYKSLGDIETDAV